MTWPRPPAEDGAHLGGDPAGATAPTQGPPRGRYRLDASTRVVPGSSLLIGGSPLRLLRLTAQGMTRVTAIAAGADVPRSALVERLVDAGAIHPVVRAAPARLGATTVVTPTRGGDADRLAGLVAACAGAARVIVVDDGSSPPLRPIPGADVVRREANGGPAAARNSGWHAATTEYVAFIDDDVVIDDPGDASTGWLATLLGHFDDPAVDAVAPRVRSQPGDRHLDRYELQESPLDLGAEPALVTPGARVSYVPAAAVVFRRSALEAIDGFDASLRFGEDVDAVWRLVERGSRCRYEPAVSVVHRPRSSWRAWARQRWSYGSSAAPLERRHPGALAPVRTTGWSIAVWGLAAARRPLAATGVAVITTAALARKVPELGPRESTRLAALGHLHAGRLVAASVRRVWWPIVVVGAIRSRGLRRVLLASAVAVVADGAVRRGPRRAVLRLADDIVYSSGVWAGVLRHREVGPLRPRLISWPGRRDGGPGGGRWERVRRWLRSAG